MNFKQLLGTAIKLMLFTTPLSTGQQSKISQEKSQFEVAFLRYFTTHSFYLVMNT